MPVHPYGVLPLGNLLSDSRAHHIRRRKKGLGAFHLLPDPLIIRILDIVVSQFSPRDSAVCLSNFSAASTFTLAFAADEDLWRILTFRLFSVHNIARAPFRVSWRDTFLFLRSGRELKPQPFKPTYPIYSDILFHKWRCLTTEIRPEWLITTNISRISYNDVTIDQFRARFEKHNVPVIITDCVKKWPAFSTWSKSFLSNLYGDVQFHAGGFNFRMKDYLSYCHAIEGYDDQPLYVFDKEFASKAPSMASDYDIPKYFTEDLFKVLGSNRPDYRWLIIGPARSGSSFHKDPNSTSAWNAVIRGRKKWVMFPPDVTPPGVYPSGDGGDVTAPVSVSEWFLNFYDSDLLKASGARECIVEEGELIFVPMGWWHCVLNLEMSIAVTQNYVGSCNFVSVLQWVRSKPKQISGCRSQEQMDFLRENLASLVRRHFPHVLKTNNNDPAKLPKQNFDTVNCENKRKRRLWDVLEASNIDKNHNPNTKKGKPQLPVTKMKGKPFTFGF